MKAEDFLTAPSAEDFLTGADGSGEMTYPIKRRRGTEKARYVAPDNPDNPIAPAPGLVAESIRMPAPTFDEERKGRAAVDALIAKTPAPTPRAPRPQRDIKAVAQDLYSILGNTGVQLVKPFVDIPNMMTGGALDPAVRFLNNAGQAANLAASSTTNYDRETLSLMPEGASIDKVGQLLTNPGLAANMGVPSVASMAMPLGYAKGMSALFPRAAAALGPEFQTANAVTANALMNAGDTFGQTEANTGGRLLAALGAGVNSVLVGKATGGGLEGQLARGGKIPTVGAALKGVGNESLQEFGENVGNQFAQDTGEGKPLNVGKALDEGTIGALLAPFVSGPVNLAQVAGSPQRRNANLLAGAIEADSNSMPARPDVMDNSMRAQPAPAPERAVTPATPAPIPQLPYDPTVQNPQRPVVVDQQGNARTMSADEFLAADETRHNDLDGRGALSHDALIDFCRFFLETCLDQIRYMRELLSPSELQRRMELYVRDEESAERLPKRSYVVLREALLSGELERGRVPTLIDTSERTARRVVAALVDKRLLVATSHKSPLRLGFPIDVVERWFPKLYPMT